MIEPIDTEPVYLDLDLIAERIGVKRRSVSEFCRRGDLPEPDLVWLGKKLWLAETIDAWRAQRYVRKEKRPLIERRHVSAPSVMPRLGTRAGAAVPRGKRDKRTSRKSSSVAAVEKPLVSTITEEEAAAIAAELRADGAYCTTADVMVLADVGDNEAGELEHERQVLRDRIRRKLL